MGRHPSLTDGAVETDEPHRRHPRERGRRAGWASGPSSGRKSSLTDLPRTGQPPRCGVRGREKEQKMRAAGVLDPPLPPHFFRLKQLALGKRPSTGKPRHGKLHAHPSPTRIELESVTMCSTPPSL
ncbi:hypothetical protein MUK42_03779 [Musa troglodytarum]|uniref:Uncharacterized protein n=1 Tax=Musa troglodytarum TaxID=320322 RepID=A0A9E7KFN0_9LILI|nr:hypothetical protein MUK42_03779 [Musa troglodytarum]